MTISLANEPKEKGPMLLKGTHSRIQSSTDANDSSINRTVSRPGALRAGIATALVALTLLMGFGRPSDTAAFKSESLVCTTIEAGFQYTFSNALGAKAAGDTKGFNYWNTLAQGAQSLWYDMGCGDGSSGGGYRAT